MQFPPGDATGNALEFALRESVQIIRPFLEIDWNRDGSYSHPYSDLSEIVSSVQDERQVIGDTPDRIRITAGHSSAELTAVIEGSRSTGELPASQLFSPYCTASPLYGIQVTGTPIRYSRIVSTVVGEVTIRQFTGWIRSFRIDQGDSTVSLVASDVSDIVGEAVTLPHWCIQPPNALVIGATPTGLVSSSIPGSLAWAVEETLRQAGRPSGPVAKPDAIGYVSCNGTFLPSVGNIAWHWGQPRMTRHGVSYTPGVVPWKDGKYGLCPKPISTLSGEPNRNYSYINATKVIELPQDSGDPDQSVEISMWFEVGPATPDALSSIKVYLNDYWVDQGGAIRVAVSQDGLIVVEIGESGAVTSPRSWVRNLNISGNGWHYLSVRCEFTASNVAIHTYVDGSLITSGITTGPSLPFRQSAVPPPWRPNTISVIPVETPLQHVQVAYGPDAAYVAGQEHPPMRDGRPLATPYSTLTELQWIPDVLEKDAWSVLQDIVRAEFAVVHTNEYGQLITVSNPTMRQAALDALAGDVPEITNDQVLSFIIHPSIDNYANSISMVATSRYGVIKHVYVSGPLDMFADAGQTLSRVISFDNVVTIDAKIAGVSATPPANGPSILISSVSAVRGDNVDTEHPTVIPANGGGVSCDLRYPITERPDARSALIQWWVNSGQPSAYIGSYIGGNQGSFRLSGVAYSDAISQTIIESDAAEIGYRGKRRLEVPQTDWLQTPGSAAVVAQNLLKDTVQPAPLIEDIPIPADPRLQLRDVVALTSDGGFTGKIFGQILGIKRSDTKSDSTDLLTLRIIKTPNEWTLGDDSLSQLGISTTLG